MALFDFLKRKKQVEKAKEAKKPEKPAKSHGHLGGPASIPPKADLGGKQIETTPTLRTKGVKGFSYEAVDQPHISEKATYLAEKNQYIFNVSPNFNKNEVKNAVEGIYRVDVLSVNVVKIPAKKRRIGRTEGFRKGYKKAIIKIKEGQKIEIL